MAEVSWAHAANRLIDKVCHKPFVFFQAVGNYFWLFMRRIGLFFKRMVLELFFFSNRLTMKLTWVRIHSMGPGPVEDLY